jgi:hypothetical protein
MMRMEHLKTRMLTAVQNFAAVQKVTTINPIQLKKESADDTCFVPDTSKIASQRGANLPQFLFEQP